MHDDDYIVIGGLVLLMVSGGPSVPWGAATSWTVPVPDMHVSATGIVYPATVSQEFRRPSHMGVDLMYRRRVAGDQPSFAPGTHDGNPRFFAPPRVPILAARDGVLWSADKSPRGFQVVLDHGKPFATYYQHIEELRVPLAQRGKAADGSAHHVAAGDVIGFMGFDPTDPEGLRHLHFAVWYNGAGDSASVDPGGVIASWRRSTWSV